MFLQENTSQTRLMKMEQGYHGLNNNSILSQKGFVKEFSQPSNPTEHDEMPYDSNLWGKRLSK